MQHGSLVGVRQSPLPTRVPQVCCLALQYRLSMGEQTGLPNMVTASALCGVQERSVLTRVPAPPKSNGNFCDQNLFMHLKQQ